MARHEVVFQDFAELAARLGLDAGTLTTGSAEEPGAAEREPEAAPVLPQPQDADAPGAPAWAGERAEHVVGLAPEDGAADPGPVAMPGELAHLLAELAAASDALAAAAERDETARAAALAELQRYDALVAARAEAERAGERARGVRHNAAALHERAFGEAARSEAARVLDLARHAEACATEVVERNREEAERLAAGPDFRRLLEERNRQEAAAHSRAEATARAARRAEALGAARRAMQLGHLEEALALTDGAARELADGAGEAAAEIAALRRTIDQRMFASRVTAVEAAVRDARGALLDTPAEAVARLEALDALGLDGLPLPLLAQRFGVWARACARWCEERRLHAPLRYAPVPGRGAVFARETPDGPYVLVSAIGTAERWRPGDVVGGRYLRGARPLCVR